MKKIVFLILITSLFGCNSIKQIGAVNMISTRNIYPDLKYKLISSYSGGSEKELSKKTLKKSKSITIEAAIDQTVKQVPGGEFLMNAKIYLVDSKYIAIEGDVWGNLTEQSIRGFSIGTKVTWKNKSIINGTSYFTGIITALKNNKVCLVKADGTGKTLELEYDDISKVE